MGPFIKIEQAEVHGNDEASFKHDILSGASDIFFNSPLDNVTIQCGDGASVSTSAVLLAVISPWLKSLMESTNQAEEYYLCIPSTNSKDIVNSIKNLTEDKFLDVPTVDLIEFLRPNNFPTDLNTSFSPKDVAQYPNEPNPRDQRSHFGKIHEQDKTSNDDEWKEETDTKSLLTESNGQKRKKGRPRKFDYSQDEGILETLGPNKSTSFEKFTENGNMKPMSLLCQECGKVFKNNTSQDRHKYDNHVAKHKIDKFSCDCDIQLNSLAERERHMKVDHLGWFGCQQCILAFKNRDMQEKHTETHSVSFICDICGYVGNTKSNLSEHKKRIHETNIVKCPDCEKIFKNDQRLMHHKRKVHMARQCPICGEIFKTLRVHLNTVHKSDSEKKYQCQECGKGFYDRSKLESHRMSIHIKSRPHRCRYGCDIGYNDVSNRNSHEKKKHGGLFIQPSNQT